MGTRVSFQIGQPAAIVLYAVDDHPNQRKKPVEMFEWFADTVKGTDLLLDHLLHTKYRSDGGSYKKGDPIFRLDFDQSQSEYKLILDPVTRVIVKVEPTTNEVEPVVAQVTKLLSEVNDADNALNEAEESPTGDSYNDLHSTVKSGLEQILAKLQ